MTDTTLTPVSVSKCFHVKSAINNTLYFTNTSAQLYSDDPKAEDRTRHGAVSNKIRCALSRFVRQRRALYVHGRETGFVGLERLSKVGRDR